ncbi:MAG: hypothetical protein JF603_13960 [Acidobacteria bacterium]|nr:hypothetical protein [Acidobacteriota bacterium]
MVLRRGSSPHEAAALVLDDVRLALDGVQRAADLRHAFDQACVGATRVTGGRSALIATGRHGSFAVAGSAGELQRTDSDALLRGLEASTAPVPVIGPTVMVVPLAGLTTQGALGVFGAPVLTRRTLELYCEMVTTVLNLRQLLEQAANAAHRVQPVEGLSGALASVGQGDGLVVVGVDNLESIRDRQGVDVADSLVSGAGAHLLNATRPPGDLVVALTGGRYLVVLRELKAPIDTVAVRVLDGWRRGRPTSSISIGAALHVHGSPLDTLECAEGVLASATVAGGDRVLVAAVERLS